MRKSRRQMLKMVGMAPFLVPPIRGVLAAEAAPLKRLVIMMRYNGAPLETWYPKSISDFSGSSLAPLDTPTLRQKLVVMKGLNNPFVIDTMGDHHRAGAYGIWAAQKGPTGGVSLDQYIADRVNFGTPRKSIMLGAVTKIDTLTSTFYKASGSPADIEDNPYTAIDSVFRDFVKPTSGTPASVDLARGRSAILDAIKDDIGRLSGNLVGEEKQKLEAHLSFVRTAELGLTRGMNDLAAAGASCEKVIAPSNRINVSDVRFLPELAKLQIGLLSVTMACDISRIFVLQMLSSYTNTIGVDGKAPWCDADIKRDGAITTAEAENPRTLHQYHHASTKHPTLRKVFTNINTAYAELFAHLLTKLNGVDEGGGKTLLDNSVVILGSEYGGNTTTANSHDGRDLPILLAGGGSGFFKTGQVLNNAGRGHTQLLGSLLEYFGLDDGTGNASKAFGDRTTGYSFASLPGLKAV